MSIENEESEKLVYGAIEQQIIIESVEGEQQVGFIFSDATEEQIVYLENVEDAKLENLVSDAIEQ